MASMLAVDLGAQSGRVSLGRFDGRRLSAVEVHRFANVPVRVHETLYWDVLRLYDGVLSGVAAATADTTEIASVGVDSWGVDFGLLDRAGRLVQNPVHYRDGRTEGAMERAFARVPARELYERTGIQLMPINTVFQLSAMAAAHDPALAAAERLLLIPDLLHYWLSGFAACEWTNATTSQCLDPRAQAWAVDLLDRLEIPTHVFPDVIPPASVLGPVRPEVAERTRLGGAIVVAPATHDTGSAVAAVPFLRPDAAYVSAGTWSLVGLEVAEPTIDDRSFAANLTNEGGVGERFRLLRNVTGLWLLHECRRTWAREGNDWTFDELVVMADAAAPLRALVDPDDPSFAAPDGMPARIQAYCTRTGQEPPETPGEIARCVLESIALAHARALARLGDITGAPPPEVHVVGGGARNRLLCQSTADATGLPVLAGPEEATVIGNLVVQALALGELASLDEARSVVRASFPLTLYEPHRDSAWEDAQARFAELPGADRRASEEVLTG
jgi:rhamnulokinase